MKAVEIQPDDDVVVHTKGVGWRGVIVMSTRRTVKNVRVDSTKDAVMVTFHSGQTETFRLNDEVEVERHA